MYFFVYLESSRTLSRTLSTSGAVSSITNPSFQSTLQRAPRENPPSWVSVALRGRKKTVRESFQQRRSNASDSLKCLIFSYIFLSWSLFEMREELFRSYQGKYHKLFNEASLKQERPWEPDSAWRIYIFPLDHWSSLSIVFAWWGPGCFWPMGERGGYPDGIYLLLENTKNITVQSSTFKENKACLFDLSRTSRERVKEKAWKSLIGRFDMISDAKVDNKIWIMTNLLNKRWNFEEEIESKGLTKRGRGKSGLR